MVEVSLDQDTLWRLAPAMSSAQVLLERLPGCGGRIMSRTSEPGLANEILFAGRKGRNVLLQV
ncbi:hypothetical protein BDQ17DRAFT_845250 [Cyathus striatus]|nr:hypothetical protein BDQ17DRAFT_845250 [Cyathus striatus]